MTSGGRDGCKDLWILPCRTHPVAWKRLKREITFGRVAITVLLLAGFYLLLIAVFGFFQYVPYFRFFLLCIMGFAFLVITYLLKQ